MPHDWEEIRSGDIYKKFRCRNCGVIKREQDGRTTRYRKELMGTPIGRYSKTEPECSAEENEKQAMIREGICPADVATSMPGYEGPEVTCKTCPDNDGCEYRRPTLADLAEGLKDDPEKFILTHQKQKRTPEDYARLIDPMDRVYRSLKETAGERDCKFVLLEIYGGTDAFGRDREQPARVSPGNLEALACALPGWRITAPGCEHLNVLDPNSTSDPELRVLWCRDCGALLMPGGTIILPGAE